MSCRGFQSSWSRARERQRWLRPAATTCASGYTPRARPGRRRAPCTCIRTSSPPPSSTPSRSWASANPTSCSRRRSCFSPTAWGTRSPFRSRSARRRFSWPSGPRRTQFSNGWWRSNRPSFTPCRPFLQRFLRTRHSQRKNNCTCASAPPLARRCLRTSASAGPSAPASRSSTASARPRELGELQINGPTSALMYWNQRERTKSTFQGPWTRSGDKYTVDEQGYYTYGGRSDDMLKVSGIYVSPVEVEAALITHEVVLEAAVVGAEDENKLVKPKAFIVLKAGHAPSDSLKAALDRVPERIAENGDRQDPTLQIAVLAAILALG